MQRWLKIKESQIHRIPYNYSFKYIQIRESQLEEVLTTYTKLNKSASIFLGGGGGRGGGGGGARNNAVATSHSAKVLPSSTSNSTSAIQVVHDINRIEVSHAFPHRFILYFSMKVYLISYVCNRFRVPLISLVCLGLH